MKKKGALPKQTKTEKKSEKKQAQKQEQEERANKPESEPKKEQKFSLYNLLELENGPKSTIDQIKKQYRKLVIVYHPDKNLGDENAKQKFHKLKQAYDILSDPEKKLIYDETGTVGDNFDEKSFQTAYEYFRTLYKKIDKDDIEDFEKKYRHGDMEKEDLIEYYENNEGNMIQLLQSIPLSRNQDIPRFIQFFEEKIADKSLKKYKSFDKTKTKVRELEDQTEQFQKQAKQRQQSMKDLIVAIRNKPTTSFLDTLQQKYAPKKQKVELKQEKQEKKRRKKNYD